MHARVVTSQTRPDQIDAALALYRQQLPTLRDELGCEGALLLTDQTTGKGLSISLWATEAAMRGSEATFQERVAAYGDLLAGQPTVEYCEVGVCDLSGGEAAAARVTASQVRRGQQDEAIRLVQEAILPAARNQPGFAGLLQCVDRSTGKGLAISLWTTPEAMQASETGGYYAKQLAKVKDLLAAEPTRTTYTVAVRMRPPLRHSFAIPIPPGQTEACRRLIAEWTAPDAPHRRDYEELQRQAGIGHEAYWLQTGPQGDMLIVASDNDQRAFTTLMAEGATPAAREFRQQIQTVLGFDPAVPGPAPDPELLADWRIP
jgi:quinol monooxygenase YgiN